MKKLMSLLLLLACNKEPKEIPKEHIWKPKSEHEAIKEAMWQDTCISAGWHIKPNDSPYISLFYRKGYEFIEVNTTTDSVEWYCEFYHSPWPFNFPTNTKQVTDL